MASRFVRSKCTAVWLLAVVFAGCMTPSDVPTTSPSRAERTTQGESPDASGGERDGADLQKDSADPAASSEGLSSQGPSSQRAQSTGGDKPGSASEELALVLPPSAETVAPERIVLRTAAEALKFTREHLPEPYRIAQLEKGPAYVFGEFRGDGVDRYMGLATGDAKLAVWSASAGLSRRGTGRSYEYPSLQFDVVGVEAAITSIRPVWLDPQDQTLGGFIAGLVHGGTEEQVVVIAGSERPYVVRSSRTPNLLVELSDADHDSILELVEYKRVFETSGSREILVNRYEWDGSAFALAETTPVLRAVNRFLDTLRRDLNNGEVPFPISWLVPEDNAPSAELPMEDVTVPRIEELPVELGNHPWHISYRVALGVGFERYLYRIHLLVDPFRSDGTIVQVVSPGRQ